MRGAKMTSEIDTSNPDVIDDTKTTSNTGLGNKVTLFNDNVHTFDEVTNQIMLATNVGEKEAFRLAYIADSRGSVIVYSGEMDECVKVSDILNAIGLKTQISV
jgi:ATP-dependent Clp protease adaptor protein ClpS